MYSDSLPHYSAETFESDTRSPSGMITGKITSEYKNLILAKRANIIRRISQLIHNRIYINSW